MDRDLCARLVREHMPDDALVIGGIGTAGRAWREQRAPQLTYFPCEPMGVHMSLAAGLALAQPDRQVYFFGGDGDLLLNLGALVTLTATQAGNLRVVIFNNQRYETGGGMPLPGGDAVDLVAIARAAGLPHVAHCLDEASARQALPTFIASAGPSMLVFRTDAAPSPYPQAGAWAPLEERAVFMHRLQQERQGA